MLSAAELKAVLRAHGLRLTSRLGQHHLVDAGVVDRLMARMDLPPDATVVEIGAGLGALTEPLAQRVRRVIAVEVDPGCCRLLRQRLAVLPQVEVQCQDILAFPWGAHAGATVVGAIPYQITSPLLVAMADAAAAIREAWIILQEEVAQRVLARPGTKAYGRLTVLAQFRWAVEHVMAVPRRAFFPQPRVDSSCIVLRPHRVPPVSVRDEALFFAVVKAAFSQRRKTLINCLMGLPPPLASRCPQKSQSDFGDSVSPDIRRMSGGLHPVDATHLSGPDMLRMSRGEATRSTGGLRPSIDRPAAAALVRQAGGGATSRGETLSLEQF